MIVERTMSVQRTLACRRTVGMTLREGPAWDSDLNEDEHTVAHAEVDDGPGATKRFESRVSGMLGTLTDVSRDCGQTRRRGCSAAPRPAPPWLRSSVMAGHSENTPCGNTMMRS